MKVPIYLLEGKQYKPLAKIYLGEKSTIGYIKETVNKHFSNKYQILDFFINPNESLNFFQDNKYDKFDLSSVWERIDNPFIVLISKTNFMNLPADMKKYLIEKVEPLQALELCKTVKCDWKKLLNINYDFVTQGFVDFLKTDEEKFRYLAERVSKNNENEPEIIFVHFNGKALGKKSFFKFEAKFLEEEVKAEILEEMVPEEEEKLKGIIKALEESPAVDWLKQDDENMWIKVNDREKLPDRILVHRGQGHNTIMRDNDLYDYPDKRKNYSYVELENYDCCIIFDYPGTVNINTDVIKNMLIRLSEDDTLFEKSIEDQKYEIEYNAMMMLEDDRSIFDKNKAYNVYDIMKNGFTRSESEVFIEVAYLMTKEGEFLKALEQLYNFTI